jgi:hypothetical protein
MREVKCATCAVEGPLIQQVRVLPRQMSSQPGSYPSDRGGNEAVEAWETEGGERPPARWQAVTRVNTETAPKVTMRRSTLPGAGEGCYGSAEDWTTRSPIRFAGVVGDGMSSRINGQRVPCSVDEFASRLRCYATRRSGQQAVRHPRGAGDRVSPVR